MCSWISVFLVQSDIQDNAATDTILQQGEPETVRPEISLIHTEQENRKFHNIISYRQTQMTELKFLFLVHK